MPHQFLPLYHISLSFALEQNMSKKVDEVGVPEKIPGSSKYSTDYGFCWIFY